MAIDLKPCPFCGGKAEISFSGNPRRGGYIITRCKICKASAGPQYYRGNPIEIDLEETVGGIDAGEAWNMRFDLLNLEGKNQVEEKSEPKATIWLSMLKSPAYQSLTASALILHEICLTQTFSKKKTKVGDYRLDELEFCLSYGYLHSQYPELFTTDSKISRAKKELLEKGFIEEVSAGGKLGQRSIYRMSDRWKTYVPEKKHFKGHQ